MESKKVQSLRQKLGIAIGAGILITVAILVIYSSLQTRKEAILSAENNAKSEAADFAGDIRLILEDAMDVHAFWPIHSRWLVMTVFREASPVSRFRP